MKICSTCKSNKSFGEFYKNKVAKDGYAWSCKSCMKNAIKKHYDNNQSKLKKTWKVIRDKYLSDWVTFFKKEYGDQPCCDICDKKLEWWAKNNERSVHFDHRREGREPFKESPKRWLRRPLNEQNINIWRQCDFGILCSTCNRRLPTYNRRKWLKAVNEYIQK